MTRPFQYVHAFIWTFAATVVLTTGIGWTRGFYAGAPAISIGVWEVLAYGGASFGLLRFHGFWENARKFCGLRPTHPALFVIGIALGVALQGPAESLRLLVEHYSPPAPDFLEQRRQLFTPGPGQNPAIIALVLGCVGPFMEELFFRGAVYGGLRRYNGPGIAAALSGVCFVVGHTNARIWLPLAMVAFGLSYLRAKSGSLMPSLGLHVGFNSVTVTLATPGVGAYAFGRGLPWPWLLLGWVLTPVLLFLAHLVAERSARARAARIEDLDD